MGKTYHSNPIALLYNACKFYRLFKKAEAFTPEELYDYQYEKLKSILDYAMKHVPYYRKRFHECGFEIGDFKSIDDLKGLPYLTKDILRSTPSEDFLSDESPKLGIVYVKTSGSTGVPLSFACDIKARAAKFAITFRAFQEAGYSLGAPQFYLKNCFYQKQAFQYSRLVNRTQMHAYMNSKENARACELLLRKHPPIHILAHPNALLEFGSSLLDVRFTFRNLKGISTMSEPLTPVLRKQIEDCFGAKVFDYYSNKESSLIAYETRQKGFILGEHFSYSEIVPSEDEVADSMHGEVVSTTFYSYAMPLIRYRNADIVRLKANMHNGAFREVEEISGRTSEAICLPDGNKVRIFNFMHSQLNNVRMYQIVQESLEKIYIDVVPIDDSQDIDATSIIDELKSYIGNEMMQFELRKVSSLQKTEAGKTPRIISKI